MSRQNSSVQELAEKMIAVLEAQRTRNGDDYPIPLSQLLQQADSQALPELSQKAINSKSFKERILRAQNKNRNSLVVFKEDLARLADSTHLLETILESLCTPAKRLVLTSAVVKKVEKALQAAFADAVQRRVRDNTLPATVGHVVSRNKEYLFLQKMPPLPPPKKPEVLLAEKLLHRLKTQRSFGRESYPMSVERLSHLTDPEAPASLVQKATSHRVFTSQAIVAKKNNPKAPVALIQDLELLVESPPLLEWALDLVCDEENPTTSITRLKSQVEVKLKKPFAEAIERQIQNQALPAGIEYLRVKRIGYLHPLKFPLKDPPEVQLSMRLVQVLDAQRRLGASAYPLSFQRLAQLTDLATDDKLCRVATQVSPFKDQAVFAGKLQPDTPVSFATDLDQLAGSSLLLYFLIHKLRGPQRQAFSVTELKKGLESCLRQPFEDNIQRQMENNQLPAGIGWFSIAGNKKYLILIQDIHQATSATSSEVPIVSQRATAPTLNFVQDFEQAFAHLNREKGSHNFVSLLDLRRAVPAAREIFDAELRQLRLSGRYTLSAAEGRHGLLPEEREAGILEDGVLLLYVSRKIS